jgi:hypothetical protein
MGYEFGFGELNPPRRAKKQRKKGRKRRRGSKPIGRGIGKKMLRRAWRKLV